MKLEGSKSDVRFLLLLLAISLGFNLYLAREVFLQPPAPALPAGASVPSLAAGETVPPLVAMTLDGRQETIDPATEATIFYFFSPACQWCAKNLDNIRHLEQETRGQYRFVGVSLGESAGLDDYLLQNPLPFPVYSQPTAESQQAYQVTSVPQTTVVSKSGEVLQSWSGAFGESREGEIEGFFGVELPGLKTEEAPTT